MIFVIGYITKEPNTRLPIHWVKSNGSPVIIHAIVPLKSSPAISACAGAYSTPKDKKPCTAHTIIYKMNNQQGPAV